MGYLGPRGSYHSHVADELRQRLDVAVEPVTGGYAGLYRALRAGRLPYGVIAVETNLCGMIEPHFRSFLDSELVICAEVAYCAAMVLAGRPGTALTDISQVHSHPEALAECREWLREHLPDARIVYEDSSAAGAHAALRSPETSAAICAPDTAQSLGLALLADSVCDPPGDVTRFWVLGSRNGLGLTPTRTSLLLTPRNSTPASLVSALGQLNGGITRIDSVSLRRGLGDYALHVDFAATADTDAFIRSVEHLAHVRRLGSYPDLTRTA